MLALSGSLAWGIIVVILAIALYICTGLVCGRVCVEIIREKNEDMSEVLWFWLCFLTGVIGVILTLIVKEKAKAKDNDKK